jgi:Asp-tRNA(Asn)/Glu-tRNA(Gln) amidotransferase A subunit family amidase
MTDIDKQTISKLHKLLVKKTISPRELLQETVKKAQDSEPKINAFREFTLDAALESARLAENKFLAGHINSKVLGIPFSIKDNVDVKGAESCFGSLSKPVKPKESAPVAKSLFAAGGCLIGKTNMTEFGAKASSDSPLSGITSNPRNLDYTTGGSSAGAAASVAAGVTSFAIGTDGGGSTRIPASFCGLVGFKPTFGLIPVHPPPIVGDLFHIGIIARTVDDILEVFKVVADQHHSLRKTNRKPKLSLKPTTDSSINKKIFFFWSLSDEAPDAAVKNVIEKALKICDAAGMNIVYSEPMLTCSLYEIFESKFLGGIAKKVSDVVNFNQFGDREIIKETERYKAQPKLSEKYVAAEIEKLEKFFSNFLQNMDLLMCPTVLHKPFLKSSSRPPGTETLGILEWPSNCILANLLGLPAVTIPCGTTSDGLPIGIQLISRRYEDIELLSNAHALYELLGMPCSAPAIVGQSN